MKNRIINVIQKILIAYLISMLLVLLGIWLIGDSIIIIKNGKFITIAIFAILPLTPMLATYMYLYVKEAKHFYKVSFKVYRDTLADKDKEITDLNEKLVTMGHDNKSVNDLKKTISTINKPEFDDNSEKVYICPNCNKPMTRSTKAIVFCDNPSCNRKQFKKEKL